MDAYKTDLLDLRRMDCMDLMKDAPDKFYSLAIVDPPYNLRRFQNDRPSSRLDKYGKMRGWNTQKPPPEYWLELFRVSRNQIIWGGNYFSEHLATTQGWFIWHKHQPAPSFADGEMAWTSFDRPLVIYDLPYFGTCGADIVRIHAAQKPVKLYTKLIREYAKPGDTILDTHLGSGSIAIACHYAGYHLTACELDKDYFDAMCERVERETSQLALPLDMAACVPGAEPGSLFEQANETEQETIGELND